MQRLIRGLIELREAVPDTVPQVILNRVRRGAVGIRPASASSLEALERYAGVTPWGFVPEDRAAFDTALAAGRTLPEVAAASPAAGGHRRAGRPARTGRCGANVAPGPVACLSHPRGRKPWDKIAGFLARSPKMWRLRAGPGTGQGPAH